MIHATAGATLRSTKLFLKDWHFEIAITKLVGTFTGESTCVYRLKGCVPLQNPYTVSKPQSLGPNVQARSKGSSNATLFDSSGSPGSFRLCGLNKPLHYGRGKLGSKRYLLKGVWKNFVNKKPIWTGGISGPNEELRDRKPFNERPAERMFFPKNKTKKVGSKKRLLFRFWAIIQTALTVWDAS